MLILHINNGRITIKTTWNIFNIYIYNFHIKIDFENRTICPLRYLTECCKQGRTCRPGTWAGWSAGQVGRHVRCWSKSKTIHPINMARVWRVGKEGSKGQSHEEEGREGGMEQERKEAKEGGLYLGICAWILVTPLLRGPVCLLS